MTVQSRITFKQRYMRQINFYSPDQQTVIGNVSQSISIQTRVALKPTICFETIYPTTNFNFVKYVSKCMLEASKIANEWDNDTGKKTEFKY